MKLAVLRRGRSSDALPGTVGVARLDRRTKRLTGRLRPGDIAVIDHVDLDRISAEALVAAGVAAVVNAAPTTSGRYPNLGPEVLLAAGVPLLDRIGDAVFGAVRDGDTVRVDGDTLYDSRERVLAVGTAQDAETIGAAMAEARAGLTTQLEAFAANTTEYLLQERDLLLDGAGVPDIRTDLAGRHVVVVVAGYDHREDLRALRRYIREYSPVLLGVDAGADALVRAGYRPDVIVGDAESVSDDVLTGGAEVVVHAFPDGFAPGLQRVQDLGVPAVVFPAAGTSEDVAMLLADAAGASLIVAVGTHATLAEFLDKGRLGMSSTFLTRLRIGGKLVDAQGVTRLYRPRISVWSLVLLVLAALVAMATAVVASGAGEAYDGVLQETWQDLLGWAQDLLGVEQ